MCGIEAKYKKKNKNKKKKYRLKYYVIVMF